MEEKSHVINKNGIPQDLIIEQVASEPLAQPLETAESEQIPMETNENNIVEQTPEPPKETHSQRNFKALKTEAARLAKERDEAMALIRQYEMEKKNRQLNMPVNDPVSEYQDYDFNIGDDALVEGKHINTLKKELRSIKKDMEQERVQLQQIRVRSSLLQQHPDYDQVVTAENLKALELLKPHLAKAINVNDPYNAGLTCYDLIKEFGIDSNENHKSDITKALIKENLSKPKPGIAVAGTKNVNTSPMGRASEFYEGPLTDEMKKIFYQELKDAMNGKR